MNEQKLKKFIHNSKEIFQGFGLVAHLGLTMVISIMGCFFLGLYLEKKFNLGGMAIIVFLILGIAIGAFSAYKLLQQDDDKK